MSHPRLLRPLVAGVLCGLALPALAGAQSPAPATTTSRLQISQVQSGPVAAPDVRVTEVNGKQATLAGGYVGWLTDRRLLVGGAGYVLTNRADDFTMQYGGGLVRWTFFADRPVAISTGVFAGFGTATIARPFGELFELPSGPAAAMPAGRGPNGRIRFGTSPAADTPIRIHDDFTMAEPQLTLVWSIRPWLRLDVGAGYRFIGNADLTGRQLRGPSGGLALQFGGK